MNRARLLLVQLLGLAAACVSIDGGAIEARWVLRNARGIAVDCTDSAARIDRIAFALTPVAQEGSQGSDPCTDEPLCQFDCARGVGTTPFIIPEGRYAMSLVPMDSAALALDGATGVVAPAPIIREVRRGQLTNLNVNLIIVDQ